MTACLSARCHLWTRESILQMVKCKLLSWWGVIFFLVLACTAVDLRGVVPMNNHCRNTRLEDAVRAAQVVVSGTIRKLVPGQMPQPMNSPPVFRAEVEVKRIFKGETAVDAVAERRTGQLRQYKIISVEGFGNLQVCDSRVRERDTKIFLLTSFQPTGAFTLGYSVLPLTVSNLDYVDALVRDIPFRAEKPPEMSACFLYFCPWGGTCRVNQSSQLPECQCEQQCQMVLAPVCGTDRATYLNTCLMEAASCLQRRRIQVAQSGPCGVRNPCEGQVCKFGAECMPSIDGTVARCQCPLDCPSYGDSVDSTPVCGNDGQDYANLCELRKSACYRLEDIRVKYYGKCDPCEGFQCESPKVCQVSAKREPECHCSYVCSTDLNLVCGSDGRTYSNQCLLRKQSCKSRKDIRALHSGKCSPESNPCLQVQCGPEEECSVDRTGKASCVCPPPCEPVLRRVCGNDSTTYDNECELRRRSCEAKVFVTVKHPGPCGPDFICHNHFCDYGAVCTELNGQPVCQCPQCTEEYSPVCGDNGITYENECKLRQENCQREENVKIKKEGSCDGCGQQSCEFYAVCESVNGQPRCLCPTSCVQVDDPVCGNDIVTYANECELRVESCRKRKFLTIVSRGHCDKCRGVKCEFNARCENGICVCPILCPTIHEPVCGTDDRSYINECEMRKYSCDQRINIEVAKPGECDGEISSGSGDEVISGDDVNSDDEQDWQLTPTHTETCNWDNCLQFGGTCHLSTCACRFSCQAVRQPVCGSDGHIYSNKCALRQHSCSTRHKIVEQPLENCDDEFENEACDGLSPLVNPLTLKDYDCTPGRDVCPAQSYCHITAQYSKCCQDDSVPTKHCSETRFGCCSGSQIPAPGPWQTGCPAQCQCNPIGSYSSTCDPQTHQCTCKPGVGGKQCDRCERGYWGLHKIAESGNAGCIPCSCNKFGSQRDDCEQMTGRCMCKPKVVGMKCDTCHNGNLPGPTGCTDFSPGSCQDLVCGHGATCREDEDGNIECVCGQTCQTTSHLSQTVCGTDGQNYGSPCQLELFGCRMQKDIAVAYFGSCRGVSPSAVTTSSPVTKSRKTTRDIEVSEGGYTNVSSTSFKPGHDSLETHSRKCSSLGDLCLRTEECCTRMSLCLNGLCSCQEGHQPDSSHSFCQKTDVTSEWTERLNNMTQACLDNPCTVGQCLPDELLGFRCLCPLGKSGSRCERDIVVTVPSFNGRSYLELRQMTRVSQDMVLEVSFSTLNSDGILLFSSQFKNGTGDFVSLTIKDGFVEFRFDLGAGTSVAKSQRHLEIGRHHRVRVQRQAETAMLFLDGAEPVTVRAQPSHTSLELSTSLFLGSVPKDRIGVQEKASLPGVGLVGCVYSLTAGSQHELYTYHLGMWTSNSDLLAGADISECGSNPCSRSPCQNGGTCLVVEAQVFECKCKAGYKGITCQEVKNPCASQPCQFGGTCIPVTGPDAFFCQCVRGREGVTCDKEAVPEVFVPQFTGDSYMEMPLEEKLSSSLSITVWFKSLKPDGVLFFATQSPKGQGDFIALNLVQNKLVLTFFLGSGLGHIESKKHIHMDKWHKVTVERTGRTGQMLVDGHEPVLGEALGSASVLNIDNRPLFVGGFRQREDVPAKAGIQSGFHGAIQRIIINGRTIDGLMSSALTMRNISTYTGPPCNVNPCLNGGVCVPMLNLVDCRCPSSFVGDKCQHNYEQVARNQPVKFDGSVNLNFPNEVSHKQERQQNNRFIITFRTSEQEGILLLQAGGENTVSDYLVLSVHRGQLEFSFNLGKQGPDKPFVIRSIGKVADGQWHTAKILRWHQEGSLQVDNQDPVVDVSEQGTQQLDTDGTLWVAGRASVPWGLSSMKNFVGCISYLEVNGQQVVLTQALDRQEVSCT